ncbi:putative progesterone binding protein [Pseudovirgaria hyperparasitica]|uniref:Progesterone binding protein n=1 Tax=Pseudovirgaria hyperparasitica TaxID=470096 RepID=A0A6A6VYP8_9PEZI|nr:putative progesterone binding protein [Pseudovirgaria hyperparasitica]KAF2755403.1 putative progesterone binding protein [Pseudovirgaria hyperparasitica]
MSDSKGHVQEPKNFAPKVPVTLDPPKSDPITQDYLAKCDGTHEGYPTYVAIKGKVYDVSNKDAYGPGGQYHVFAGKDASRALAKSSLKAEEAVPQWQDLDDKEKTVLEEWVTFFSKRYNVMGVVQGASNL